MVITSAPGRPLVCARPPMQTWSACADPGQRRNENQMIKRICSGLIVIAALAGLQGLQPARAAQQSAATAKKPAAAPSADQLDKVLAPIALYPDQLLAQILQCAGDPAKVQELNAWIKKNTSLKGTQLQ